MFVYHFIFRGFMLTLQKKFKKGLLATVFAFTLAQSPAHAVEKPNFMPAQCLGVAGITAVVMGGLLNPEHLRGLIELWDRLLLDLMTYLRETTGAANAA